GVLVMDGLPGALLGKRAWRVSGLLVGMAPRFAFGHASVRSIARNSRTSCARCDANASLGATGERQTLRAKVIGSLSGRRVPPLASIPRPPESGPARAPGRS